CAGLRRRGGPAAASLSGSRGINHRRCAANHERRDHLSAGIEHRAGCVAEGGGIQRKRLRGPVDPLPEVAGRGARLAVAADSGFGAGMSDFASIGSRMSGNPRVYGSPPYRVVVVHGGPGAAGQMAPVARRLSEEYTVLEPMQSATSVEGQVDELR